MKRYFVAVFVIFAIMALGIVLIARGGDGDNKPENTQTQTEQVPKQLHEYGDSGSARVVYTTEGAIVGDDQYRAIRITVGRNYRTIDVLDGYTNRVQKSKTFSNTQAGFDTFLRSLEQAGYTKSREVDITDERGVCPNGNRFIYETFDGDQSLQRTWSTTCGRNLGTFNGNTSIINRLFQGQITDYKKFVSGVRLR